MTKAVGGPHGSAAARRKTGSHIHSRSKYTNFFRGFPSSAGTFFFNRGSVPAPGGGSESGRAEGCPAKRAQGPRRAHGGQKARRADRLKDGKRAGRTGNGRTADKTGTGGQAEGRETGGRLTEAAAKKERSGDLAGLRTFSQSDAANYLARHSPTFSPIASPRRSRATIVPSGPKRMICGMPLMP